MKTLFTQLTLLFFLTTGLSNSQTIPAKNEITSQFGFEQNTIKAASYDITYYQHQIGIEEPKVLILYIQGSDPSPLFSYDIRDQKIRKQCWIPGDFKNIPENSLYVAVEKTGFEGVINNDSIPEPEAYLTTNSLHHRVDKINRVINHLTKRYDFSKVIVYGHSEGAPVAAKLGTVNNHISHIGFWCGNALPDFFDFILESRIAYHQGKISVQEAQKQIDQTISGFTQEIANDTSSTAGGGYTNLRWWSYAEPPINHLLKIEIPLYVLVASNDQSAPIESTYLIPLEFARLQKKNLTYKVCVGCDHGLTKITSEGDQKRMWGENFLEFLDWAMK